MHSVIFEIRGFTIASYGLMVAVGMLVGVWVGVARAKRIGENPASVLDLTIWVVIAGIIGARFMYVFMEGWHDVASHSFLDNLKLFIKIRQGGLSFLGALLFAVPVGILYLKTRKLNVWNMADIAGPSIAVGIAFARIGCFLNGCCFGKTCPPAAFYATEFPVGSIPFRHYHGLVPIYPTQLISSLNALIIFFVLTIMFRYRKFRGQIFWIFVLLYSITRFMIDFLRADSSTTFFGGLIFGKLTLAQGVCIVGVIASVVMLLVLRKRPPAALPKTENAS